MDPMDALLILNGVLVLLLAVVLGAVLAAVWVRRPARPRATVVRPDPGSDADVALQLKERETAAMRQIAQGLAAEGRKTGVIRSDEEWQREARQLMGHAWGGG